jgi:hypothetical protein
MNGHCSYWLINLTNDDPFDYLSKGTFSHVEQQNDIFCQNSRWIFVRWNIWSSWTNKKNIPHQDGQWVSNQIRLFIKLNKQK